MKILSCILFFCLHYLGYSQTPEWISYTSGQKVNVLANDGEYLWIGTDGGLFKMNMATGERVLYNKLNSGLRDNRIQALFIDSDGSTWVGSGYINNSNGIEEGGGIARFDGQNWTVYTTDNSPLLSNYITGIAKDSNGTMWFTTYAHGIASLNGTEWTSFFHDANNNPYLAEGLKGIAITSNTMVWAVGEGGNYSRYWDKKWETFSLYDYIGFAKVSGMHLDRKGVIWLASEKGLLNLSGYFHYRTDNSPLPSDDITTINEDKNGNLWMGSGNSVVKFDGTNWTLYNSSNSVLPEDRFISSTIDSDGNIWVGTANNGVYRFDGVNWTAYTVTGLPGNAIGNIVQDNNGKIWISHWTWPYTKKLTSFDGTAWNFLDLPEAGTVMDLLTDKSNNLWVALDVNGIYKYNGKDWTHYNSQNSALPGDTVLDLSLDSAGNVWAAATGGPNAGGVAKFDGTQWTAYTAANSGMPANKFNMVWAHQVVVDRSGNIWVASWNNESLLLRYDGTGWTTITPADGLPDGAIDALAVDGDIIWAGTRTGLAKLENGVWTTYTAETSPLPGNYINRLSIASDGIWIATNSGMARFDGSTWNVFTSSNSPLPVNNINCIMIDRDNRKWIGTSSGIAVYREGGTFIYASEENSTDIVENFIPGGVWSGVEIYPNPARNEITFSPVIPIEYHALPAKITIFNPLGVEQRHVEISSLSRLMNTKVDLDILPSGMYYYAIQGGKFRTSGSFSIIR